eukprot:SAG22_NODE_1472_length_4342_cov_3.211171_2_plen_101_part_00
MDGAGAAAQDSSLSFSLWVGNIPLSGATEAALGEALRTALIVEGEIGEGDATGVTKCTVRVKPEKKNGSWALMDFNDVSLNLFLVGMAFVLDLLASYMYH